MDELLEQLNTELAEEVEKCNGCPNEKYETRDWCEGCSIYERIRDLAQHIDYMHRDMEERHGTGL